MSVPIRLIQDRRRGFRPEHLFQGRRGVQSAIRLHRSAQRWQSSGHDEIEECVTGFRHAPEADSVLATVLFTDIVGSTEVAARLGNRAWRDLLERHHSRVRRRLEELRGREIDTAGVGFFASFDGPGRGVRCASAVSMDARQLGLEVRTGLHTGECEMSEESSLG